jgi:hypothetical protein
MGEIKKTMEQQIGNSFVNNGGPLMNLMAPFHILNNVYRWNFDTMARLAIVMFFNATTLNPS